MASGYAAGSCMGRSSLELRVVGKFVLWIGGVPWSIVALSRSP
jgi:hypothetical protein